MTDHGYRIGLWLSNGVIPHLIQWHERCVYSHAGFLTPGYHVIEASYAGMISRMLNDDPQRVHWFDVPCATLEQWQGAEEWLKGKVADKTPYSYGGFFAFLTKRRSLDAQRLFCSQAIFAAFRLQGIELLCRISEEYVSPALLSYSPLLVERQICRVP